MDRGWYVRFFFVLTSIVASWFVLWPSLDQWVPAPARVKALIERRISPGLDIRGGLRLMYEVEVDEAVRDRRDLRSEQFTRELGQRFGIIKKDEIPTREQLKQTAARVKVEHDGERGMRFTFQNAADAAKLDHDLVTKYGDVRSTSAPTSSTRSARPRSNKRARPSPTASTRWVCAKRR